MIETQVRTFYQFLDTLGFSHPVHAAVAHLPIGFVVGAFILGSIAMILGRDKLALSAHHCTILAIIFWLPAVLFGLTDWVHYYGYAWLPAIRPKMVLAGILLSLLLASLFFEAGTRKTVNWILLPIYACSLLAVVSIGWYGAQLVYGTNPQLILMPYKSGYQVFVDECKNCHPSGGNIMDAARPIKNSPKLKDIDTFIAFLRHSDGNMPPFESSTISDHEAEELYQYIISVMNK